jgi:hypothetical protein
MTETDTWRGRVTASLLAPAVAAIGVAAVISVGFAPTATAQSDDQSCTNVPGADTVCESPGNVQINATPQVDYAPQYPFWEGDTIYGGVPDNGGGDGHLEGLEPPPPPHR